MPFRSLCETDSQKPSEGLAQKHFYWGGGGSPAGAGSAQHYSIYGITWDPTDSQGQILMEDTWVAAIRSLYLFEMTLYFEMF